MPISIRRWEVNDIINIQQLNNKCYTDNYDFWIWSYHHFLSPPCSHVAVDSNKKLVGFCVSKVAGKGSLNNGENSILTSICIKANFRRMHIGSKLVEFCHKVLRDIYKHNIIEVTVNRANYPCIRMFTEKLGYKCISDCQETQDQDEEITLQHTFQDV